MGPESATLFLAGDVMIGRGIDQILPNSTPAQIHEGFLRSAKEYVRLAIQKNGPIPAPVTTSSIWGDALQELKRSPPEISLVNLETSVTLSPHWEPKGINYRVSPANAGALLELPALVCSLANNHVLDWGPQGLLETLDVLRELKILSIGAGRNLQESQKPVEIPLGTQRILIFALAFASSGVPASWAATSQQPGIHFFSEPDSAALEEMVKAIHLWKKPGDCVLVSIHWGENWGYQIPFAHQDFARKLIARGGVDLIHGHSSHHPLGIEIYRDKLILYGCGDFINDYEGIEGYEEYRGDLSLMYFPEVSLESGKLKKLRLVPLQIRNLSLHRAPPQDAQWCLTRLHRECAPYGVRFKMREDFSFEWSPP